MSSSRGRRLRDAVKLLSSKLRPRLPFLHERGGQFRFHNLIGTIDLGAGDLIEIAPKVDAGKDWKTATVSLLTGAEALHVAGERRAGVSLVHNDLLDGIAAVYLDRLERAFRQEGPILLLERKQKELPHLQGTLNVTRWAQQALWRPHIFPVSRVELAHQNPFTFGLVRVADTLAKVATNRRVVTGLTALSRGLSPGLSYTKFNVFEVASRTLPEQWSAYKPAWSLAVTVLTKTSLFRSTGTHAGLGVAVEAWPLLETLLEQTLRAAKRIGLTQGRMLDCDTKRRTRLLTPACTRTKAKFFLQPDGRLFEQDETIATFEAKYTSFDGGAPEREHIYQSLSAAAACNSPVAVLAYPGKFEPQVWRVHGFNDRPTRLLAMGLDMFTVLSPDQSDDRGEELLTALEALGIDHFPAIQQELAA